MDKDEVFMDSYIKGIQDGKVVGYQMGREDALDKLKTEMSELNLKAYTVAIPNLPLVPNRKVKAFIKRISELDGFYGIHPRYPLGTLIIFDTENNAKSARNLIQNYKGYNGAVGNNICEIYISKHPAQISD